MIEHLRTVEEALMDSQNRLAIATAKQNQAASNGREVAIRHDEMNDDLKKEMKTCSDNYVTSESEICALKKIRGELYKMSNTAVDKVFVDCEVEDEWIEGSCTQECKSGPTDGWQTVTRGIATHPNDGAKCLPLVAKRRCGLDPCPVDCEMSSWEGWSA